MSGTFEESMNPTVAAMLVGHFNNQGYHVPPLTLNMLTNALLKHYAGGTITTNEPKISVVNHPLPRNLTEVIRDLVQSDATSFNVASGLTFGYSFLVASFVVFIIKEKTTNSRHIQYLSGCSPLMYWTNAFVWDFISYMIPTVVVILLLWVFTHHYYIDNDLSFIRSFIHSSKAFDIEGYIHEGRWLYTLFLLVLYGLSHTPQMYLLSFLFKVSATGLAALTAWNVISSK